MHIMNSVRLRARIGSAFLWTAIGLSLSIPVRAESANARYGSVFDEIGDTIAKYFYDPRFVAEPFGGIRKRYAEQVAAARSQFAEVVDAMLAELKASHTHYYTPQDPAYYQVLEGDGIEPDIAVPMDLEYLAGNDRQLQKALEYFAETFKQRGADYPPPPAR
jgi:C-terminal processing protease CtpA/Prc